jgi:hypothetical protein
LVKRLALFSVLALVPAAANAQWAVVDAGALVRLGKEIGLSQQQLAEIMKDTKIAMEALTVYQDTRAAINYMNSGMGMKQAFLGAGVQFVGARYGNDWGETAGWSATLATGGAQSAAAWTNSGIQVSGHLADAMKTPEERAQYAQIQLADGIGPSSMDASGACAAWENNAAMGFTGLMKLAADTSKLANSLGVQGGIANLFRANQAQRDRCIHQMQQAELQIKMAEMQRQRNADVALFNRQVEQEAAVAHAPVNNGNDPNKFATEVIP